MIAQLEMSEEIQDVCPSCNPRQYVYTTFTFANEIDDRTDEALYLCIKCCTQILVDVEYASSRDK